MARVGLSAALHKEAMVYNIYSLVRHQLLSWLRLLLLITKFDCSKIQHEFICRTLDDLYRNK